MMQTLVNRVQRIGKRKRERERERGMEKGKGCFISDAFDLQPGRNKGEAQLLHTKAKWSESRQENEWSKLQDGTKKRVGVYHGSHLLVPVFCMSVVSASAGEPEYGMEDSPFSLSLFLSFFKHPRVIIDLSTSLLDWALTGSIIVGVIMYLLFPLSLSSLLLVGCSFLPYAVKSQLSQGKVSPEFTCFY